MCYSYTTTFNLNPVCYGPCPREDQDMLWGFYFLTWEETFDMCGGVEAVDADMRRKSERVN